MYFVAVLTFVVAATLGQAQFYDNSVCINPNGRQGICEPITECESLYSVLHIKPLSEMHRKFLRDSTCSNSYGTRPYVCCTWDTEYDTQRPPRFRNKATTRMEHIFVAPTELKSTENRNWESGRSLRSSSVPHAPTCGGVSIANRILGGTNADRYEFPWMALLEYNRISGYTSSHCAGSLINKRYVLTAAHCVTGAIETEIGKLVAVRLGEHDTSNKQNCLHSSCSSDAIRIAVEEVIPHDLYDGSSANLANDIALVRLRHEVVFNKAIRPICLPSVVEAPQLHTGTKFTVAGWGATLQGRRSTVKQKLDVEMMDLDSCRRKFSRHNVAIEETQFCAGGVLREDSCEGDSGGPLMRLYNSVWIVEGIVSFGYKCGLEGWPGVYTRVASYSSWILDNLED